MRALFLPSENITNMKNYSVSACRSVRQMLQHQWRSNRRKYLTIAGMAALVASGPVFNSCRNVTIHEIISEESSQKVRVNLNVASFGIIPFDDYYGMTKAQASDCCKKIHFALFQNDTREVFETQDLGADGFGTLALDLSVGPHQLLILAHNGDGNPTMTKINSVSFNNKETLKTTDTFYYCQTINVTADGSNDFNLALQRAVAAFRITVTDNIPQNVVKLGFSYTGGSGSLNPLTGWGATKSTQSEEIAVTAGNKVFEVYSFPGSETAEYKFTVTAYDERGNNLTESVFEKVPLRKNQVTTYQGHLFDGGVKTFMESGIGITVDNAWGSDITYTKPVE